MSAGDNRPLPVSPVPASFLDEAETLTGALSSLVGRFPDFPCLLILDAKGGERWLSLGELWERARAVQSALAARRLEAGAVVLLAMPTSPELLATYFGAVLCGAVPALVSTPSNRVADLQVYAQRIGRILEDAHASVFCCNDDLAALFEGEGSRLLAGAALLRASDVRDAGQTAISRPAADDIATVQYSSGSTGDPKGILLTHRAMLNNIRAVRDGLGFTARDVHVNWIPLYHDMGLIDAFLVPLLSGCVSVLIPTMDFLRSPALWMRAVERYRGTVSWAPNFAYTICARRVPDGDLEGLDLSSWRIAINAAEPVLATTIEIFTERFRRYGFAPRAMTPAWGLAENVTIATAHPVDEPPRVESIDRQVLTNEGVARPTQEDGLSSVAVGRCLPHCEVQCRGDDGRVLPDRHVGTIWLRSNSLFLGYHGKPEATRRCLVDGWLDTGDRGYLDGADLYFVSRDKDLVVIGGEKYAPHDIENAINRVAGVREGCAVAFGVLNESRGTEDVAAVVETKLTDERERAELRDAIRAEVMHTTGLGLSVLLLVPPGGVEKTTSGKLARRATKDRYRDRLPG